MYWDFPSVSPGDRLEHSPALDPSKVVLSPEEAAAKLDSEQQTGQVRLNTFDGRPVYRFRTERGEAIVYADTGEDQIEVPDAMMNRAASAWSGQPVSAATIEPVEEADQWTIQSPLRKFFPMSKYSWPNGQQVYVAATGEVVQYTTTASRWGAYVGAIPHWLNFLPLRKYGEQWSQVVIWSSGIATLSAIIGIVIGIWMYSPAKRYRYSGAPTSIPYRGQKRWHMIFGLIFGLGAATWAFSGMLSMDPFPALTGGQAGGGRRGGAVSIPQALRGPSQSAIGVRAQAPARGADAGHRPSSEGARAHVLCGEPVCLTQRLGPGQTRIIPVKGAPQAAFDRQRIIDVVSKTAEARAGPTSASWMHDRASTWIAAASGRCR